MSDEISESGAPIHRHKARESDWTPPNMEDSALEAISDHIEKHIGPIATVWHEIISDLVHIDVHQVAPTEERPYWTLVTSGMSDLKMTVPPGREDWAHAELMICLPKDWKMGETDFKDERHYWPVRWLKTLARFPHEYQTWLSWGHTLPNGDPAEPVHDSAPFTGFMLLCPKTTSTEFWTLPIRDDKQIRFFALMPLHTAEMEFKLRKGGEKLEALFEQKKVTELVDLQRPDVTAKPWWRLW